MPVGHQGQIENNYPRRGSIDDISPELADMGTLMASLWINMHCLIGQLRIWIWPYIDIHESGFSLECHFQWLKTGHGFMGASWRLFDTWLQNVASDVQLSLTVLQNGHPPGHEICMFLKVVIKPYWKPQDRTTSDLHFDHKWYGHTKIASKFQQYLKELSAFLEFISFNCYAFHPLRMLSEVVRWGPEAQTPSLVFIGVLMTAILIRCFNEFNIWFHQHL